MYLLAKKLPHTLVSGENEKFKEELAKTEAKDIVKFAEAVKSADPTIDGKVCKKVHTTRGGYNADRTKCDDSNTQNIKAGQDNLSGYASAVLKGPDGAKKWPEVQDGEKSSEKMADDLFVLQRAEKSKVAGLLSKTVSGAEVVEIRAVSSAIAGV